MRCPKCQSGELVNKLIRGIAIERCNNCNGIWFDAEELPALLKETGLGGFDKGAIEVTEELDSKRILCPMCKEPCIRAKDKGVYFEACPVCKGLWLDGGEFEKLYAK